MNSVIAARQSDLVKLCREFHVKRLDLFGSGLSAAFDPELSDLDFLVEFEPLSGRLCDRLFRFQRGSGAALWAVRGPGCCLGHPKPVLPAERGAGQGPSLCGLKRGSIFTTFRRRLRRRPVHRRQRFRGIPGNPMLRLAVERAFAIIGEALAQLARLDAALTARITEFTASLPSATFWFTPTRRWMTGLSGESCKRNCQF